MATRKTAIKSKLVMKDLDEPAKVKGLPVGVQEFNLGRVVGRARSVITRNMPNGDTFYGLSGDFKGTPTAEDRDIVRSGILYLPNGVFELVADQLRDPATGEVHEDVSEVAFIYDVKSVKATNAAGYSWAFVPVLEPAADDPLAQLEAQVARAAIEAPKEEVQPDAPSNDAPAPVKGKGGK